VALQRTDVALQRTEPWQFDGRRREFPAGEVATAPTALRRTGAALPWTGAKKDGACRLGFSTWRVRRR